MNTPKSIFLLVLFSGILFAQVSVSKDQLDISSKTLVKSDNSISPSIKNLTLDSTKSSEITCKKLIRNSCTTFICTDGSTYDTCNLCKSSENTSKTRKLSDGVRSTIILEKNRTRENIVFNSFANVSEKTGQTDFIANIRLWLGFDKQSESKNQSNPSSSCREQTTDGCTFKYCPIKGKEELAHITCPSIGYGIQWWTIYGACEYKAIGYDKFNKAQCTISCEKPLPPGPTINDCPFWMNIPDWKSSNPNNSTDYFSPFAE